MGVYGEFALRFADFNAVDASVVEVPAEYLSLDQTDLYYVGTSDNIMDALEPGDVVSGGSMDESATDVYVIGLEAGDELVLVMNSSYNPPVMLYNPAGFQVADWGYMDDEMRYTAEEAGSYLVVIESYWGEYELIVAVD